MIAALAVPDAAFGQAAPANKPDAAAKKGAAGAPDEKAKAQARSYLSSGNRSAAAGEWDDAFAEHTIAWRLHGDWETAGALGKSAFKTKHYAIALLRLTYYLASAPDGRVSATESATIKGWIESAKQQVGYIQITAPSGSDIHVDGEPMGQTPLPEPIPADPGKHEVQIRAGYPQKRLVVVAIGKTEAITIEADPDATAPSDPSAPPAAKGSSPLRIAGLAAGGALFAGGLVVGGVFAAGASEQGAIKQSASKELGGRTEMQDAARAEAEARNIAFWGFVGAAVAAAGTTTFYFTTRKSSGATVTGAASVRSGGPFLSIQGEF